MGVMGFAALNPSYALILNFSALLVITYVPAISMVLLGR
jgi:hypothetical protein